MQTFLAIQEMLSGYKAYLVGMLAIGLGLYYNDRELVMLGLSTITIRAGVAAALNEVDKKVGELSGIHNILVRRIGEKIFTSFHCLAPADHTLDLVHEATDKFECLMKEKMKEIKRVVIHVEPSE